MGPFAKDYFSAFGKSTESTKPTDDLMARVAPRGRLAEEHRMNDSSQTALVTGALSALVAGVLTYLTTSLRIRKDLEARYDLDLRERRIRVYKQLWAYLEPFALYSPPGAITRDTLRDLSASLRRWYFESGGMFFSERARDDYFALQKALQPLLDAATSDPVGPQAIADLVEKGSSLRTSLARDVGTRQASKFTYD
jgi:hypothetical protein